MPIPTATDKLTARVHTLTDEVLQGAEDAVKTTRNMADSSLGKAQDGVSTLRKQVDPAIDELAAKAQELASKSIEYCAETSARARRQIQEAADVTSKYVAEQPGKSMAIAVASGAALATLIMWLSRRRDGY